MIHIADNKTFRCSFYVIGQGFISKPDFESVVSKTLPHLKPAQIHNMYRYCHTIVWYL